MTILGICDNGDILSVLRIVKIVISIIRIVVPIILIISISITLVGAVKDKDDDALNKSLKSIVTKSIAAILVFLIPTFINILANISDSDDSYLSCLKSATAENITATYRLQAEKLIDTAYETLNNSDYSVAKSAINKIKDENVRNELLSELSVVGEYIDLKNQIHALAKDYDRDEYKKLKEQIDAISDEGIKEKLLEELNDSLGGKGSIEQYILDPNDPMYRNLKHFSGTTLKDVLEKNGSSVEKLEMQIEQAVDTVGVGTREAPVVAALTLFETLAGYGFHINYDWGGKWYKVGVNGNWGVPITPIYCDSHPNPDYCRRTYVYKGFDCSGFVNWALVNGFRDDNYQRKYTGSSGISLTGKTTAVCDTGDVLVSDNHIVLVVKPVDEKKSYLIAESTGGYGTRLAYYGYSSSEYKCVKIDYSN